MTEFRTTREVAEALGVQEWRVESAIRRREIERPPMVGGVRLWAPDAVERLRRVFARRTERGSAFDGAAPARSTAGLNWTTDVPGGRVIGHLTCACGQVSPLIRQVDADLVVEFVRCTACGNFRPAGGEGAGR